MKNRNTNSLKYQLISSNVATILSIASSFLTAKLFSSQSITLILISVFVPLLLFIHSPSIAQNIFPDTDAIFSDEDTIIIEGAHLFKANKEIYITPPSPLSVDGENSYICFSVGQPFDPDQISKSEWDRINNPIRKVMEKYLNSKDFNPVFIEGAYSTQKMHQIYFSDSIQLTPSIYKDNSNSPYVYASLCAKVISQDSGQILDIHFHLTQDFDVSNVYWATSNPSSNINEVERDNSLESITSYNNRIQLMSGARIFHSGDKLLISPKIPLPINGAMTSLCFALGKPYNLSGQYLSIDQLHNSIISDAFAPYTLNSHAESIQEDIQNNASSKMRHLINGEALDNNGNTYLFSKFSTISTHAVDNNFKSYQLSLCTPLTKSKRDIEIVKLQFEIIPTFSASYVYWMTSNIVEKFIATPVKSSP